MDNKPRLLRIATVPLSLHVLLHGQLAFMRESGFEVLAVSAGGPEVVHIRNGGIPHEVVNMTRQITPFSDMVSLFQMIKLIKKFKPHIVHTHTPKAGLIGMMAAWYCRAPIRLHTVAGLPVMEAKGIKRLLLLLTEKITYACATAVFPNSFGLAAFISKHIKTKTPVTVIGKGSSNGIDVDKFSRTPDLELLAKDIRRKYSVRDDDFVFCFVGRIVRDKGINELTKAFQQVRKLLFQSSKRIHLMLVGHLEQELDPISEEELHFLRTDENVIMPGFQADVRPWMMAADAFVFPSYREGFPNVVMQACSLGIPCIVSDINGCNEIVSGDETGLIVPVKDTEKLTSAMIRMVSEPAMRQLFVTHARQFVHDHFDQQYIWHQLLRLYQEACRKRI
jgi:glycosyltransferase involved in cell wall biosynthesis